MSDVFVLVLENNLQAQLVGQQKITRSLGKDIAVRDGFSDIVEVTVGITVAGVAVVEEVDDAKLQAFVLGFQQTIP
jgi:hypothetical protein